MSTSFIYHAFGLQGYCYVRQNFGKDGIVLTVSAKERLMRCPLCGADNVIKRGRYTRRIRTVPIGPKPVWLVVPIQRVECRVCACVRRIALGVAEPRRRFTRAFERYALALSKKMSMRDVTDLLRVGWDTIKSILKRHLLRRFSRPKLSGLRHIAIDEISVRKGQRDLTLVMDLESGAVVFVGDGRSAETLTPFWKRLKRAKAKVKAVTIDMNQGEFDGRSHRL